MFSWPHALGGLRFERVHLFFGGDQLEEIELAVFLEDAHQHTRAGLADEVDSELGRVFVQRLTAAAFGGPARHQRWPMGADQTFRRYNAHLDRDKPD